MKENKNTRPRFSCRVCALARGRKRPRAKLERFCSDLLLQSSGLSQIASQIGEEVVPAPRTGDQHRALVPRIGRPLGEAELGQAIDRAGDACFDLWLFSLGSPFYWGYFLKALAVTPLLALPFSKIVLKVWFIFTAICIPLGLFFIFAAGINAFLDKLGMSDLWGIIYFFGTLAIIVFVSLGEWIYKKRKH